MRNYFERITWFQSGLFWRTFLLLAILVTASMTTWIISIKLLERKPRAQQLANQINTMVSITSAAITHAAENKRRELLIELAHNEGINIYLLEESDRIIKQDNNAVFAELMDLVQQKMGKQTQFAKAVNGETGFWVSFRIEEDHFWLRIEPDRLQTDSGLQFLGWAAISLSLALVAAAFISRRINEPLSNLSLAARQLALGRSVDPLLESGPREIRETNASFNQMMEDLARIESDRTVILAGISHDLRTPLTRLQLELEMTNLKTSTREAMRADLQQMDDIIQQFLDYAKPILDTNLESFNFSALLKKVLNDLSRDTTIEINATIEDDVFLAGSIIEIQRLLSNLIENAQRYGRNAETQTLRLEIELRTYLTGLGPNLELRFRDFGVGIVDKDIPRLLRPFTRGEVARSHANGSGLGLAIIDRIVKRHGGKLHIRNHITGGLEIQLNFPLNTKNSKR
jgi:two-component system osmolarity sensor histidine kinase EnvZ